MATIHQQRNAIHKAENKFYALFENEWKSVVDQIIFDKFNGSFGNSK